MVGAMVRGGKDHGLCRAHVQSDLNCISMICVCDDPMHLRSSFQPFFRSEDTSSDDGWFCFLPVLFLGM